MRAAISSALLAAGVMANAAPVAAQQAPTFAVMKCTQTDRDPVASFSLLFKVATGATMAAIQPSGSAPYPFSGPQMFNRAELVRKAEANTGAQASYTLNAINDQYEVKALFDVVPGAIQSFVLALAEGQDPDAQIINCDFGGYTAAQAGM